MGWSGWWLQLHYMGHSRIDSLAETPVYTSYAERTNTNLELYMPRLNTPNQLNYQSHAPQLNNLVHEIKETSDQNGLNTQNRSIFLPKLLIGGLVFAFMFICFMSAAPWTTSHPYNFLQWKVRWTKNPWRFCISILSEKVTEASKQSNSKYATTNFQPSTHFLWWCCNYRSSNSYLCIC